MTEGVLAVQAHGAELVFFTVMPRYSVPVTDASPFVLASPQDFQFAAKANADRLLAAAAVAADRAGLKSRCEISSGEDDAQCIVDATRRLRCHLIVVASEGRNALMRMLLGSVIPRLITSSPVPVLVCKLRPRATVGAKAAVVPLKTGRAVKPAATKLVATKPAATKLAPAAVLAKSLVARVAASGR